MAAHAAAAVRNEILYLSMLHTMKYKGTTPVEGFLKKFELARNQLMAANPQTTPDNFLLCLSAALHDPINPPAKGRDWMAFVGPSTWLDEQEPTEVDTYDRLKAKLEIKFTPTIKTSIQIINKIQTIKYSPDKTVEKPISEIDKIMGRTRLEKAKKLTDSDPEGRDLELRDLKKKLIAYDAAHRNPDPILRCSENMDIEKSAKMYRELTDKCAKLERELQEQRQLTNLNLEAQKRWANSDDAKKKDHKPIKGESNRSFRCWNCWELGHSTSACPEARRNWNERERLRQQKEIPADEKYESQLESAKNKGWFTGEV
ncbi:hypothetical protein BDD12DRAFT_808326 [Trichophaea hybrida]|nr:hypothetical protein BDD12DRAFT_808326 [Trichophaea hybrida]